MIVVRVLSRPAPSRGAVCDTAAINAGLRRLAVYVV